MKPNKNEPTGFCMQLDKRYIVRKLQLPLMFTTDGACRILRTFFTSAALAMFITSSSGYLSIGITRDVELFLTDHVISVPTSTATSSEGGYVGGGNGNSFGNGIGDDPSEPPESTEPTTAQIQFTPPVTTPTPSPDSSLSPPLPLTQTPLLSLRTIISNVDNVNINDVQNFEGAVKGTPGCAPVAATITLGLSTLEQGGARILAAFNPCVIIDGTVLLILPDKPGIQLIAANIQGGRTTQSAIIPLQRIAPVTHGQVVFGADLSEQVAGPDQARGESATLNGNVNALFLWNNSGQVVELVGDHGVVLETSLRR